jgi:hypothetical protein
MERVQYSARFIHTILDVSLKLSEKMDEELFTKAQVGVLRNLLYVKHCLSCYKAEVAQMVEQLHGKE